MRSKNTSSARGFTDVIRSAFLKTAIIAAFASALGTFQISKLLEEQEHRNSETTLNRTVSELIVPALEISDFSEVKRILGLLNRDNHLYGVRTKEGDILLEDDADSHVFDSLVNDTSAPTDSNDLCPSADQDWSVKSFSCTPIYKSSQDGALREFRGFLLTSVVNSSVKKDLSRFGLLIGAPLFIFLMTSFLVLRRVIRTIVKPIQNLHSEVKSGTFEMNDQDRNLEKLPMEVKDLRSAFRDFLRVRDQQSQLEIELARQSGLNQLATQVAHDIRSPLAALKVAREDLKSLPEDVRMLVSGAVNRIESIANQLLEKNRGEGTRNEKLSHPTAQKITGLNLIEMESLRSLIHEILSEKQLQYRDAAQLRIELSWQGPTTLSFVRVVPQDFMRVMSNLINNAVEAMDQSGLIKLDVISLCDQIKIRVSDSGPGIPPEVLQKLGHRGMTCGKPRGSGLGLHHAIQSIRSWGGELRLHSQLGQGTQVEVQLPKFEAPPAGLRQSGSLNSTAMARP